MNKLRSLLPGLVLLMLVLVAQASAGVGSTYQLLDNRGFEPPEVRADQLSPWTVKNGNGDKLKCVELPPRAAPDPLSKPCMFMFKGGPQATVLQQTIADGTANTLEAAMSCAEAFLYPTAHVYAKNATNLTMIVKVKYSTEQVDYALKVKELLVPISETWTEVGFGSLFVHAEPQFSKIVFSIRHASPNGKVFIDETSLEAVMNSLNC